MQKTSNRSKLLQSSGQTARTQSGNSGRRSGRGGASRKSDHRWFGTSRLYGSHLCRSRDAKALDDFRPTARRAAHHHDGCRELSGFRRPIQGPWLMEQMRAQAEHVGTTILNEISITSADLSVRPFRLVRDSGDSLSLRHTHYRDRRTSQMARASVRDGLSGLWCLSMRDM